MKMKYGSQLQELIYHVYISPCEIKPILHFIDEIRFKKHRMHAESSQLQHAISPRFEEFQKRNFNNFKNL